MSTQEPQSPIAIIGMSCFFPGSTSLKAYWRLLFRGVDAITEVPGTHWSKQDYYDPDPKMPDRVYCTRGGYLSPVSFDPTEFGIPPASLEATDTSQLLTLSAAKTALEDAGKPADPSRTSVILGVTGTQELVIPLSSRLGFPKWRRALEEAGIDGELARKILDKIAESYVGWQENSFPGLLGNVVAGRISNRLDLGGTNCVVDAACASSMAALHLALLELSSGRSDLVITGGADTLNDIFMHMCFSKTRILSPTGDARPFSKHADGTVLGEGIGLLVLKRLADAERDGNRIYALIKGIGSSSDGRSQSIYAPRIEGQIKALTAAYAAAGVDPTTVDLIEAHGTGTRVGDKVEFQALCQLRGEPSRADRRCALGSVKSNIGHTKAAAGAAGLVKAVLALHQKVLPPTLKADEPDPALNMDASPFYLNTRARPWFSAPGRPRRAGVSAFGFGGSNFHVVLEEHRPEKTRVAWDDSVEILAFSAADPKGLKEAILHFRRAAETPGTHRALAQAAARSRVDFSPQHDQRLLIVLDNPAESAAALEKALGVLDSPAPAGPLRMDNLFLAGRIDRGRLAFLFPGQGSQYPDMGRDLVCVFPQAMAMIEKADRCMEAGQVLNERLYPPSSASRRDAETALRATEVAQPAIGAVSLAMLAALEYFGIAPDAAGGHSFGELTALCAAGWMTPEVFFDLAVARGMAMARAGSEPDAAPGGMLAVRAPLEEIETLIRQSGIDVVLANRNSPGQGVLSGPLTAIAKAAELCRQKNYPVLELPVSGAFHSPLMQSALEPFRDTVAGAALTPTAVPVFSNSLAGRYPEDARAARQLLGRHLLQPVDFVGEIEAMYAAGCRTFVEVGPRTVLTGLVTSILAQRPFQALALDASAGTRSGMADLARTLCHLAALGYPVRLSHWEDPAEPPQKPRMQVLISGANCGAPPPKPSRPDPSRPAGSAHTDLRPAAASIAENPKPLTPDAWPGHPITLDKGPMKKDPHAPLVNALQSVQEGLKAIQAIQIQTARAHQTFLETQSEASRILLELVKTTGLTAETSVNLREAPAVEPRMATTGRLPTPVEPRAVAAPPGVETGTPTPESASIPDVRHPRIVTEITLGGAPDSASTSSGLEAVLLAVVSELTGYPTEMLGIDMDIEADLGIDSIKRVEILSALEEQMPGLPAVTPEDMGRLKTLGQIVAHLSGTRREAHRASAAPPNPTGDAARPTAGRQAIADRLLAVVSELTGYPTEMLGIDMDIEADLGIDSIKRVEILSALEEQMPGLPAVTPEDMGRLKTLGQIVAHLAAPTPGVPPLPVQHHGAGRVAQAAAPEAEPPAVEAAGNEDGCAPRRQVAITETAPPAEVRIGIPKGRKVFVTDDRSGLSQTIADELGELGVNTVLISVDILKYKKDLPHAGGLIIVQNPDSADVEADLRYAFELTRVLARDLMESARLEGAFFATVTRLDGAFGFGRGPIANPEQGALAGLAKTAALEWPDVRCHALDLSPGWTDQRAIARAILRELMTRGPVEVGLDQDRRRILTLDTVPYPRGEINLSEGDVIVVSGGGRGVTAACALELARRVRPTLILLGRSPEPFTEPGWLAHLEDEAEVKKSVLEHEFSGGAARPAEVEQRLKQLQANREISRTLERLKAAGAAAHFRSVDIRDAEKVQGVLADVRARYGPIRGILHGAGVVEDRLIADKTVEQFRRVFDTKVRGFKALLAATQPDELKTIVVFSSITARLGNKGQADYAMANEALNKMARAESMRRPSCRVIAVNWGPWNGGMVSPALKREFERQGVPLLDFAEGAAALMREMTRDAAAPVEVVIGGSLDSDNVRRRGSRPDKPDLALLFEREIDVDSYPVLSSHIIDGHAVVPLALMTEWFGHGALHENPGLMLHGLEDLRVLNGIRLTERTKLIRLLAGKTQRRQGFYEVELELRNGLREGKDVIHSRAKAILTDEFSTPPVYELPQALSATDYPRSVEDVYERILFHGHHLHGLRRIRCCTEAGMVADTSGAPAPEQWLKSPLRNSWLCDPLVLDSAFQMASLWCYEQRGSVSLPSHAHSYRQFRSAFPADGVTVVLEVREATDKKLRGDFIFLDAGRVVVARLTGYEAVMDPILNRAFKPEKPVQPEAAS